MMQLLEADRFWPPLTPMKRHLATRHRWIAVAAQLTVFCSQIPAAEPVGIPERVSYYQDIRPVIQAKCQGCHQPAKAKGNYVMTDVSHLVAGGETPPAVVPNRPAESYLLDQVTKQEGADRPEMPPKDEPLTSREIALLTKWIEQGARDDTPENARERYGQDHPPQYAVPPVITSLDFSPDGSLLAVSGFHEVLLHRADGSGLVARLIGLSERIERARFSPDGKRLAVAGGLPGRMGEIQIWDVAKRELTLSKPVGADTAYGASWSPDGKLVAYGMPDHTVRAIDAATGKQVLFMGSHSDWVLDTVWAGKGDHLVSVARDMTAKLTRVDTERFIDNITSITPGAAKGGINAVARHPSRDHILVGGSDGVPQIYRMYRETVRKIGDNANLIRKYPAMEGRIWGVAFAPDGKTFAAVSSLNGRGQINFYKSDYDATLTPELKKLFETVQGQAGKPEKPGALDKIEEFHTRGAERLHSASVDAAVFSVAFSPDGKTVAAGTADGRIHLVDAATAAVRKVFAPVAVATGAALAQSGPKPPAGPVNLKKGKTGTVSETFPAGHRISTLEISPSTITLQAPDACNQVLATARFENGDSADATRLVAWSVDAPVAGIDARGLVRPLAEGTATITAIVNGAVATARVEVTGLSAPHHPDFIRDVNPVITRLGCNAGTCHGAKEGKAGFKLSLRGYDFLRDVCAFGDDHAARRVNFASPDNSLMLLKATGAVPHEGGVLTDIGSSYYRTIRQWIAAGANANPQTRKVDHIELFPKNPVIQNTGAGQQIRVVAHFPDGSQRDVTREAFIESGNTEVATHDDFGLITTIRRGEAPILARYEGAYAATTLTVMGDRQGFAWREPECWNEIDQLVAGKWRRMKILPSRLTTDEEFIRRIYLDLTGLPPSPEAWNSFLSDGRPVREKRAALIDSLIGSAEYVDHWTNKWADLLQVNSKFLGTEGAQLFREWIRKRVEANTPYHEFVSSILTARGSNKENPAASYFKILRSPDDLVENTTHVFLATRFNCNKCHDHPFERWNVDNYYQLSAYFARVDLKRDVKNAPQQNIGGSAVEGAKPLFEVVSDKPDGEVTNIVTGRTASPKFPFEVTPERDAVASPEGPARRDELAAWLTSAKNPLFARSYANRIWAYLTGRGIIEPIDDIRAGNPPSNAALLDHLTSRFVGTNFNVRELMREICDSRTYQLSIETNRFNEDDELNFSHAKARRLPAEVIFDAVHLVTGSASRIPGAQPGVRAEQLADAQLDAKGGFLANLGRPPRESACECDRQNDLQLGSVMSLLGGSAIAEAIGDPGNAIAKLAAAEPDDRGLIEKIYLRVLNRKPSSGEIDQVLKNWSRIEGDHKLLHSELQARETEWVKVKAELDRQRLLAIDKARGEVAGYTPEFEKKRTEAETAHKQRAAAAEKAFRDYEAGGLVQSRQDAIQALPISRFWTTWQARTPSKADATGGVKLAVQPDASILAAGGPAAVTDYTIAIPVVSSSISGFLLEALPDDSLAGFGPGLNANGNFVVTEFKAAFSLAASPRKVVDAKLVDAQADFNQKDFDVKNAINGDLDRNDRGWAVATQERRPHWARFKLEKPLNFDDKGGTLTVKIVCRYSNGDYPLGKFRISTTDSPDPLGLGLPGPVAAILAKPPVLRQAEENGAVAKWYRDQEPGYLAKRFAWLKETRPLPPDPRMELLKAALAKAEAPVPDDPAIVQLRSDVKESGLQVANRRLTGAQDLTWALINNAAFLFNH